MSATATRTVTSAFIKVPYQVEYRQVELPAPGPGQILLDVLACGICGYDMEIGQALANEFQAFGHEITGIVREVGHGVTNVKVGDQVALESSSFCGVCELCRNGRVDLCAKAPGFWSGPTMGFAEQMLAPAGCAVPTGDMDPMAAVLAEPCGVALDMVKTAEIGMTDRVLVVGTGAIGLMALAIARRFTTGLLVAANRSAGKLDIAKRLGADATVCLAETPLAECGQPYGGFDRILVTTPPQVLPDCISAAAYGGYIVFIGSDFINGGTVAIDTHALHFGKKQLRSSMASPAIYFPQALHMLRTGVVPCREIVSHRFPLSQLREGIRVVQEERDTVRKVVIVPDKQLDRMALNLECYAKA